MKIKIGDKVKIINPINKSAYFEIGDTGEVGNISEDSYYFPISVTLDKSENRIEFEEEEIELIKGEK